VLHDASAWPDWKDDKDIVLSLKGKPFAQGLTELLDEAEEAGFLAKEADEALEVAAENLVAAKKDANEQTKELARKNKAKAAEIAAEASQGAERKAAMLGIAARKSARDAIKSGDKDAVKKAREFAADTTKKVSIICFSIMLLCDCILISHHRPSPHYLVAFRRW
jgi:2,4-dienoyl-CoA reductase-like NADH-dependent reductase (Old Yellow Enzyme family)